jgi:hypothetical protein
MSKKRNNAYNGLFKSVVLAYTILIMHLFLIAGLALLVIFLGGIVNYMLWIFIGGIIILISSTAYFYWRMKAQGRIIKEILNSSMFQDRTVEINMLGGLATLKIERPGHLPAIEAEPPHPISRLEDADAACIRELKELAHLLKRNLITQKEYNQAKKRLLEA